MASNHPTSFRIVLSPHVRKIFEHVAQKDAVLHERIEEQLAKLMREPHLGKPLRYELKNRRRLHVGSFVVLYEIIGSEVRVVDFDHHDNVYKRK